MMERGFDQRHPPSEIEDTRSRVPLRSNPHSEEDKTPVVGASCTPLNSSLAHAEGMQSERGSSTHDHVPTSSSLLNMTERGFDQRHPHSGIEDTHSRSQLRSTLIRRSKQHPRSGSVVLL